MVFDGGAFFPAQGFVSGNHRRILQIIALLASISAYITIVLGGTVSGMGAGDACPDWPLCHGSLVPDLANPLVAVEYAHRLAAVLTTLFLFLVLVASVLWFRSERSLVTLSSVTFVILATQIGFGALTIASALDWRIVTVHLALGTATFAASMMVALLSFVGSRPRSADKTSSE
jgi:heme a synthase